MRGELVTTKVISAFLAKQNFGQLLEEVRHQGYRFLGEPAGKPVAVVLGIEKWENIVETLSELEDPSHVASIKEARREIKLGKTLTLEELRRELAKYKNVL